MNDKKFKRSPLTIVFYVLAGIMAVYLLYVLFTTIVYIRQYLEAYGMSIGGSFKEAFTYFCGAILAPLVNTCLLFGIAMVHDAVRKNNPDNYVCASGAADKTGLAGQAKSGAAASAVAGVVEETAAAVRDTADSVKEAAADAASAVEETSEDAVEDVAEAASAVEETSEEAVEGVAEAASAAKETSEDAVDAAKA